MAVIATPVNSLLRLEVQTGTDAAGNPETRRYSFSRVKPTAADQEVYDAAQILAGLLSYPLVTVTRNTDLNLVNVA